MSYQPLAADFSTMNDSQKNSAAIAAGYTGLNDYNDQQNRGLAGNDGGNRPATPTISAAPTIDLEAITQSAYNTPEILAANKAITDREQARATALAGQNDNPFYSQATLEGKIAKINMAADNDIKVHQGNLDRLRADAAIKVNAAKGQYDINEQAYKDNLNQFNSLLSAGALDNASGSDIANLAVTTGIPVSMIQSMVSSSQKKNNPTQLIQSVDDQGNLTLLAVDKSGKVVNQTQIAGVAKETKQKGVSAADTKASELEQNQNNAAAAAKAGAQLKELVDHYGKALTIDEIYRIYNQNAKTPAVESLASVKQGRYANIKNSGWQPAVKAK